MHTERDSIVRSISASFLHRQEAEKAAEGLFAAGVPRSAARLFIGGNEGEVVDFDGEHHRGPLQAVTDFFIDDKDLKHQPSHRGSILTVGPLPPDLYEKAVMILQERGVAFETRETPTE